MKNIKYFYLLPAVLMILSGCEKSQVVRPESGKEVIGVYITPYRAPAQSGILAATGASPERGISVFYEECMLDTSTRTDMPASGELTPEQESAVHNIGFVDIWEPLFIPDTEPEIDYFHYSWLSVPDNSLCRPNYTEFEITAEELLPKVEGRLFRNSLILANMPAPFEGGDHYLEMGQRWKELDDYFIIPYPSQQSVTEKGIVMYGHRDNYTVEHFNSIHMERNIAKVEITVSIDHIGAGDSTNVIRLSSLQLKNVPNSSCLFSVRSPMPKDGDEYEKVGPEYYMDYAPLENVYAEDGSGAKGFIENERYVWYMPANFSDIVSNISKGRKEQDVTLANASDLPYMPTYFLIKGELSDGMDWEPFELTICVVEKWGKSFYHDIRSNTYHRIHVKLNPDLPDTADDARIVYPHRETTWVY